MKKNGKMSKTKKRILIVVILLIFCAVILEAGYFLLKYRVIFVNQLFVSDNDTIGVDISKYQADVDMNELVSQNIEFVYMKATEGSDHVDHMFSTNWDNAKACGIPSGAYHFFSYDSPGATQAMNYIRTVGDIRGRMIPVVDVEYYADKKSNPPDKEHVVTELKSFLDALEAEYHVKPMIYTQMSIYRAYLKDGFSDYPKWIRSVYYPIFFEYHDDWCIWQYTDRGELRGYSGGEQYIDLDVLNSNVSLDDLMVD